MSLNWTGEQNKSLHIHITYAEEIQCESILDFWSLVLDADARDVARGRDVADGGVVHLQDKPLDLGVAGYAEGHVGRQLQLLYRRLAS